MLKIVVINGVATNGKNTFIDFIKKHSNGKYSVRQLSTVDTVKRAGLLFGADESKAKGEKERRLWSDLKEAYTRYCDGPFKEVCHCIEGLKNENGVVFFHVREPSEIAKIVSKYPETITLLIRGKTDYVPDNNGDRSVYQYDYNHIIENDGDFKNLEEQAILFETHSLGLSSN